jgi:Fic family protein
MKPCVPQRLPLKDIDWAGLVPLIGKANRSLAHYEGVLHGVPNPEVLLSPLTTREAVLSSRIEGTQATMNEVFQYEAGEQIEEESRRRDIQEIINYRKALRTAEKELQTRPFSLNLLLDLHSLLLDSVRGRSSGRGRFRTTQNWIGSPGSPIEEAAFVPPTPGRVQGAMRDWEKYYHEEEKDPLVQLAVVHAQFEVIHPFLDGNGRLGRIVIPLFLHEKGILSRPMFYLSEYLETHRAEYIEALRQLNGIESWNRWVAFFLGSLTTQARENSSKATRIIALYEELKRKILELTSSQYSVPLLDLFFMQPIISSSLIARHPSMPSKAMVMSLLKKLREAEILSVVREGSGRRPQVLALSDLIYICEGKEVV